MTILHWVRAVAKTDLSPGCKGFCLELIPHMNSSQLSADFSTKRMSQKVSAAHNTVKVYRRQLVKSGLLKSGRGWRLTIPKRDPHRSQKGIARDPQKGSTQILSEKQGDPHRSPKGIATDPKRGSLEIPPLYNSTSTSYSTSYSTLTTGEDDGCDSPPIKLKISDLALRLRPEVGDRLPVHTFSHEKWVKRYEAVRGSKWRWTGWSGVVLPYLNADEREHLLGAMCGTNKPNLNYAVAVANRLMSGEPMRRPVAQGKVGAVPLVIAGRSEDDDLFLSKISQ